MTFIDVTEPGTKTPRGRRHIVSATIEEIAAIFTRLGFEMVSGPETDTSWYNFDSLNVPKDHPARDMQDTFYIADLLDIVMRTQTSNTQVRYMQDHTPPIRIISPGRVYRNEATDATHEAQFHQCEALVVGENISLANMKHTLLEFFKEFFNDDSIGIRFRPGYFPFVEPGVEVDISCFTCKGKPGGECNICKSSGWIEVLGSGLVHPRVLEAGGIDPEKYQGFAFGAGIERLIMLRYGVSDIRDFYDGNIPFLQQFK